MALTNVFQADNIKNTSPKCKFTYIYLQFFAIFSMILLTAGALTDPQLPARASNMYTTDGRLGGIGRVPSAGWHRTGGIGRVASAGCPPNKNPGYAGVCIQVIASDYNNYVYTL